jgi:signal transduction histidine kinase
MIVEYHNGDISAESAVGTGTKITLRVPREYSTELENEPSLAA